jgi:metallo-beta-lactamase family protein
MSSFLKLKFCGGVGTATGANFLLTGPRHSDSKNPKGEKTEFLTILVDCGLEQGGPESEKFNHSDFPYDPASIDILLVTHAHTDHIGRIPKLVREGFRGVIYSTIETRKITELMYADALKLLTQEAVRHNLKPMYEEADVHNTFSLWKTIEYHKPFELHPGYSVYLRDAGHILGSSMFELTVTDLNNVSGAESAQSRKIVFTGDLGNSPAPLLRDTEEIKDIDYLLMESVYGDRNHEDGKIRVQKLHDAILDNYKRGGVLLMPVFALEKTQELLYEIHELIKEKKLPVMPIYLDAPLAIKLTKVYEQHTENFNEVARRDMQHQDIFKFPGLKISETAEDSMAIAHMPSPKIIMAGSGMSNGGRIQHHEAHYLSSKQNSILFTGYQATGTVGRLIREGATEVMIHGEVVPIRAKIESIDGYSSHKDMDHLVEFVSHAAESVKKVFVVMGESKSSLFLVQRLRDYLGVNAVHPTEGDEVYLD